MFALKASVGALKIGRLLIHRLKRAGALFAGKSSVWRASLFACWRKGCYEKVRHDKHLQKRADENIDHLCGCVVVCSVQSYRQCLLCILDMQILLYIADSTSYSE
jgi:hypothetical protein